MAKAGHKILLLEKKVFPRDKYCGDAVCKTGIEILHEMGLFDDLVKNKKAHVVRVQSDCNILLEVNVPSRNRISALLFFFFGVQADSGGLCSPGGLSYVGRSKEILGEIPAALACKRIHLDDALAKAAKRYVIL